MDYPVALVDFLHLQSNAVILKKKFATSTLPNKPVYENGEKNRASSRLQNKINIVAGFILFVCFCCVFCSLFNKPQ